MDQCTCKAAREALSEAWKAREAWEALSEAAREALLEAWKAREAAREACPVHGKKGSE